jgi:hypothetical protein
MAKSHSFRFADHELNQELVRAFKKAKLGYTVGRNGLVHFPTSDLDLVENELICSIRDSVFPSWQVVTCPSDWVERYQDYMKRNKIPFKVELSDGETWFLIPRNYRPHAWKLDIPSRKDRAKGKAQLAANM